MTRTARPTSSPSRCPRDVARPVLRAGGRLGGIARCLLLGALVALGAGCGGPEPKTGLNYSADAQRAYEEAMGEFNAHNWIESQQLFREVKRKYGYSRFAALSELRIADADYEQDKFADAIREYKQFVHDHRSNEEQVTYARARIAEAQYKEISESLLLPPGEERDQAATVEAYKEMRGFLHDFPEARQSPHVCALLEDVTIKLVKHELYVARFYLHRDNFDATVSRAQFALRNYASEPPCPRHPDKKKPVGEVEGGDPSSAAIDDDVPDVDFGLAPDALLLLGETYLKMHRWGDARSAFVAVLQRYPESPLAVPARSYLEFMKGRGI